MNKTIEKFKYTIDREFLEITKESLLRNRDIKTYAIVRVDKPNLRLFKPTSFLILLKLFYILEKPQL